LLKPSGGERAMPKLALTKPFLSDLGLFYGMWSALETTIDYQIGKLLNLPHDETHIITAGMDFGRKANILRVLLKKMELPEKEHMIALIAKIQNESKRNIFAHSQLHSDENTVTFIHRKMGGTYSATETTFTAPEFHEHVADITTLTVEFHRLLAIDQTDLLAFGQAAINESSKP
jgi:hypothetical protein